MSKINYVKQTHCPRCHSKNILTFGLDQMCTDCDWDNLKMLVDLGQLDDPEQAAFEHFHINYKTSNDDHESVENVDDSLTA